MVMISSNVLTDKDGKQAQLAEYTPFGSLTTNAVILSEPKASEGSITNYLYTGKNNKGDASIF